MNLPLFLKGLLIGFSIAAPVGPIGILCIRRTLSEGRLAGLLSGMGAATADALYGCIAGFGLTVISGLLLDHVTGLRLAGGLFLCYLGLKTWRTRAAEPAVSISKTGLLGTYTSTLLLTLTNPSTILSFLAVFAGLGLATTESSGAAAIALVMGVFLGSAAWWLLLSSGVNRMRDRLTARHLRWINRASGLVLFSFGVLALTVW
jgi:threonine/homoserine/homoserine lactone efflux protein